MKRPVQAKTRPAASPGRKSGKTSDERVFLGGTCGTTVWRNPFIEMLEKTNTPYFNPQLAPGVQWEAKHAEREKQELLKATIIVMVITNDTSSIVSLLELSELIAKLKLDPKNKTQLLIHVEAPPAPAAAKDVKRLSSTDQDRLRAVDFLNARMSKPRIRMLASVAEVREAMAKALKQRR